MKKSLFVKTFPNHFVTYLDRVTEKEMQDYLDAGQMVVEDPQVIFLDGPIRVMNHFLKRVEVSLNYYVNTRLGETLKDRRSEDKVYVLYFPIPHGRDQYLRGDVMHDTIGPLVAKFEDEFFRVLYKNHNDLLSRVGGSTF